MEIFFKNYIRTYNKFLYSSFLGCFILIILKITYFNFIPAPIPIMYELSIFFEGLLSGYITSVIFHFIVVHVKRINDKENVKVIIEAHITSIIRKYLLLCFIIRYHYNYYEYQLSMVDNTKAQTEKKSIIDCLLLDKEIENITCYTFSTVNKII